MSARALIGSGADDARIHSAAGLRSGRTPVGWLAESWDYNTPDYSTRTIAIAHGAWKDAAWDSYQVDYDLESAWRYDWLTDVEDFDLDPTGDVDWSEVDLDAEPWAPARPRLHAIAASDLEPDCTSWPDQDPDGLVVTHTRSRGRFKTRKVKRCHECGFDVQAERMREHLLGYCQRSTQD